MICESTPSCVLMITEDGKFFGIGRNYGFANKSQSVVSVETPTYISISGEKINFSVEIIFCGKCFIS